MFIYIQSENDGLNMGKISFMKVLQRLNRVTEITTNTKKERKTNNNNNSNDQNILSALFIIKPKC